MSTFWNLPEQKSSECFEKLVRRCSRCNCAKTLIRQNAIQVDASDRLSGCSCRPKLIARTLDIDDLATKCINSRLPACPKRYWGALPWDRTLDHFSKSDELTSVYVNPVNFRKPSIFPSCLIAPWEPSRRIEKPRSIPGIVTFVTSIDFLQLSSSSVTITSSDPYWGG